MKKSLIIAGLTAAIAVNAFADTHYVSHSGSCTYPYTSWATAAFIAGNSTMGRTGTADRRCKCVYYTKTGQARS